MAAEEAIRICKNRGVLVDYLNSREKEVIDIMIMLFDQEYAVKQYGKAQEEKGLKKGRKEGWNEGDIARMRDDAKGMYAEGINPDVIARIQKTSVDNVWKMLGVAKGTAQI